MANIDPSVARVLDRHHPTGDSDDEDALIAELEADDDDHQFSALREKRLEQLHSEITRAKTMKATQHGTYMEIKDEKQLMDITTSTKLCVVHFKKLDFHRCATMDEKLAVLAEKHFDTRFISRPDRNDVLEDWSVVAAFLSQATNSLFDFGRSSLAANTTQR
ncbi:hypothetical protein LTR09_009979 [Extremus antarcticus]|uniref:Thioredoxin domain-containing protein n=1 Tax=Extremus antarcticus TaxID=702011 RepID=A0AAJ0D890_9PEZI|nr:hypothetical protein LTR09_009979 [Extremus antarcticus]